MRGRGMRWGKERWAIRESDGEVSSSSSRMPETSFSARLPIVRPQLLN